MGFAGLSYQVFSACAAIVAARCIGKVQFGELGILNSTIVTLGILGSAGLGITATGYTAVLHSTRDSRLGEFYGFLLITALVASSMVAAAVFGLRGFIAESLLGEGHLDKLLGIVAFQLITNSVWGVQQGVLIGLEKFRAVAIVNFAWGFSTFLFVSLLSFTYGVIGALYGYLLSGIVCIGTCRYFLHREISACGYSIVFKWTKRNFEILRRFAMPAIVISICTQPFAWISRLYLARQEHGFAELGIFTAAFSWSMLIQFLPERLTSSCLPVLSSCYAKAEYSEFRKVSVRLGIGCLAFASLSSLPFILFSDDILSVYGTGFDHGKNTLIVISIANAAGSVLLALRAILTAMGVMWAQTSYSILSGVLVVAVSAALVADHGALGLAIGYLVAVIVQIFTQGIYVSKLLYKLRQNKYR